MTSAQPLASWGGLVSISTLSKLAPEVVKAVRQGETVMISRRGEVVAVLTPATMTEAAAVVDLDDPHYQLSTREFERGNVSAAVDRAARGDCLVLTYQNRPIGLLRAAADWQPLAALADPMVYGDPTAPLPESQRPAVAAARAAVAATRSAAARPAAARAARATSLRPGAC